MASRYGKSTRSLVVLPLVTVAAASCGTFLDLSGDDPVTTSPPSSAGGDAGDGAASLSSSSSSSSGSSIDNDAGVPGFTRIDVRRSPWSRATPTSPCANGAHGLAGPIDDPATCAACSCTSAPTCTTDLVCSSSSSCTDGQPRTVIPGICNAPQISIENTACTLVNTPPAAQCAPPAAVDEPVRSDPWTYDIFVCAAAAAPDPSTGPDDLRCLVSDSGDVSEGGCPPSYPNELLLFKDTFTDDRACSPCTCDPPAAGTCGTSVISVFRNSDCTPPASDVSSGAACLSIGGDLSGPAGATLSAMLTTTSAFAQTCGAPSGGTPISAVTRSPPARVCCSTP